MIFIICRTIDTPGIAGVGRTVINARTKNINQEEIIKVIEANGDTLDADKHDQLSNAVVKRAGDTMTGILTMAANLVINVGKNLVTDTIIEKTALNPLLTVLPNVSLPLSAKLTANALLKVL